MNFFTCIFVIIVCLFVCFAFWLSQGQHSLCKLWVEWIYSAQYLDLKQEKENKNTVCYFSLSDPHHICLPLAWLECTGRRLLYNTNLPTVGNQKPINLLPHIPLVLTCEQKCRRLTVFSLQLVWYLKQGHLFKLMIWSEWFYMKV